MVLHEGLSRGWRKEYYTVGLLPEKARFLVNTFVNGLAMTKILSVFGSRVLSVEDLFSSVFKEESYANGEILINHPVGCILTI